MRVACIDQVQERHKCRFLVKVIMNRRGAENENFLSVDKKILACDEELCSMELVSWRGKWNLYVRCYVRVREL